jgi:hypothetical protein
MKISLRDQFQESGDIHVDRAALHTNWLGTFQAAPGLLYRLFGSIPKGDFLVIVNANIRRLFSHRDADWNNDFSGHV